MSAATPTGDERNYVWGVNNATEGQQQQLEKESAANVGAGATFSSTFHNEVSLSADRSRVKVIFTLITNVFVIIERKMC